ncbi:MAG: TIGR03032 family protein [Bacteroidia bacterium]|nr:TIGR03032 family protein [Bacteroidia bacterium]
MEDFKPQTPNAPFSCSYSAQIPELLQKLNCSLAITTYQAGKVIFISPKDADSLVQLPRTFSKPMGLALDPEKDKMALAARDEIIIFANSPGLAQNYPNSPGKYDSLYMPRATFHTGALDIHDLNWGKNGNLFAVNTLFSCIVSIDSDYNFTPYWIPPFIDRLASEDRCHLNGMAMQNGLPKFASAFNRGNTLQSWRETVTTSGVIFDLDSGETVAENLPMPHSPRIFGSGLYVLLSATGELAKIDLNTGKYDVIAKPGGFVRGMALHDEYLFIGLSKLRKNSSTFAKLDFAQNANVAGIAVIHLPTGAFAGKIEYQTSVDEIYDVHVLPGKVRPNILNTLKEDYKNGLMIPNATYWAQPVSKENT